MLMGLSISAASVDPQPYPGNDSNPNDYTPPKCCIHYEIPNSDTEGTHTATFNSNGNPSPNGPFSFTVVVGTEEGEDFTKVLSWSSNFPIYAVIVKGGNGFNLYQYDSSVRGDTNLVSPVTASGKPADVSHVSVVICPKTFPPTPPTTTPTPTPTLTPTPTITPTVTPTPTCPPIPCPFPPKPVCHILVYIIFIFLLIAFFLLGLIFGGFDPCCKRNKKNHLTKNPTDHKKHASYNNNGNHAEFLENEKHDQYYHYGNGMTFGDTSYYKQNSYDDEG